MRGLYEISDAGGSRGENGFEGRFRVRLNADHAVFAGHFPGNPVLPGVCSLQIVRECASLLAGRPLRYVSIRESKFLSVITPDTLLEVDVRLADGNLTATISGGGATVLKLKATLESDE